MQSKAIILSLLFYTLTLSLCVAQSDEEIEEISESKLTYSLGAMGSPNANVKVDEVYKFEHSVKLRSVTFDKKGNETQNNVIDIFYSEGSVKFGMIMDNPSVGKTNIVYDYDNGQMITMMNSGGNKIGMATSFNVDDVLKNQNIETPSNVKFVKTGEKKNISGYNCEEYRMESDDPKSETDQRIWMASEIESDWMQSMSKIAQSKNIFGKNGDIPAEIPQGTVIQMVSLDGKGHKTMTVTVEEINLNVNHELKTTDYTFMNFSGQ